jgi:hypothetical protein
MASKAKVKLPNSATKAKKQAEITLTNLLELEADNEKLQKHYLYLSGWEHTSSTPGSTCMWRIKWNRMVIMLTQPEAIRIQKYWDGF